MSYAIALIAAGLIAAVVGMFQVAGSQRTDAEDYADWRESNGL